MDLLKQLKLMNALRCPAAFNHGIDDKPLLFWATAVGGETGELLNFIKKLERGDYDTDKHSPSYIKFEQNVSDEVADIVIYLDMLMQKLGLDLGSAIIQKFNRTSNEKNVPFKLTRPS